MSRSYKKFPCVKCETSGKFGKKQSNKKIRNLPITYNIPNGCGYKKLYESCNIYDYKQAYFLEWEIENYYKIQSFRINNIYPYTKDCYKSTLEQTKIDWYLSYKRK